MTGGAATGPTAAPVPQIISASRRTDIPAFYMPWFMQRVRAGVARRLRLRDPFDGLEVVVSGAALQRDGDLFAGDMASGQEVVVCLPGETGDLDAAVAAVRASDTSRLGLKGSRE